MDHAGAPWPLRNNSSRLLEEFGTDAETDSIGDRPQAERMSRFLDKLDQENSLPKTIVYNVNPQTITPSPRCSETSSGISRARCNSVRWWHLDQRDGMAEQMKTLANVGLLSRFVGMLTDSRSFLSFPRHEYFRRILCNLLGEWMEEGFIPDDIELVGNLAKRICFGNAKEFLRLGDSS